MKKKIERLHKNMSSNYTLFTDILPEAQWLKKFECNEMEIDISGTCELKLK